MCFFPRSDKIAIFQSPWKYQNTLENFVLLDIYIWHLDLIITSLHRAWYVSTVLYIDWNVLKYASWSLSNEDLNLNTIWGKYEEFYKPQIKEVCASFDLLTNFRQGNRSMGEWYNAVQAQVNLAKYPPEPARILHHEISWYFLHDEEFVSKTINDRNVDLEKFQVSKVRQLAKKMESYKVTWCHMKQVTGDPQAVQINLMRHQCTEIPQGKHKKRKSVVKPKQSSHKNAVQENLQA